MAALGDAALAAALAAWVGRVLCELRYASPLDGPPLGNAADRIANELLLAALAEHRPADGVLSEESIDDHRRLSMSRVWIIDPLDGTREYQGGLEEFAVHVALWEQEHEGAQGHLAAAAVALPARQELVSTQATIDQPQAPVGQTACGRSAAHVDQQRPLRIAVSRSRAPALARAVAELLDAQLVSLGSAGFKTVAVIRGHVDAYLHAEGQYEWDSAAPAAVALAHGLHASRIDGSPLRYNQPLPRTDDLLICQAHAAATLLGAIANAA